MVDTTVNHKKLVGNVCLHKDLVVERRFLRRNLRHILDSHEKQLGQQYSNDSSSSSSSRDMIANEQRDSGWDFPTTQMLEDLMKGQKPVLQVEALQIRHPRAKASAQKRSAGRTRNGDVPDWLPDPEQAGELVVPCQAGISVLDTRTSKQRMYMDTRPATIRQKTGDGRFPHFDVELDRPFHIELDKFFVVMESGGNGSRHWKRTITTKYVLEASIQCRDSDDTAELLSRIEGKDVSDYQNAPGNEGVLRAVWENLPECPKSGYLMPLRRGESPYTFAIDREHTLSTGRASAKGHKSLEADYRLEVSMGWKRRRDSPLEQYNKRFFEKHSHTRQLPTPTASEDMEKMPMRHLIVYNYNDGTHTRTITTEGLSCPICPRTHEHSSFDRLQLHLLTYHDHFKFESEETTSRRNPNTIRHTIYITIGGKQYERQKVGKDDEPELDWVAPRRPFNVSAHFRGEDDWAPHGRPKTKRRGRAAQVDKEKPTTLRQVLRPALKRPAPDDVPDLPEPRPQKRKVPVVPDVSFYRTTSKKLMKPGEEVAESDDDVDETWLAHSQSRALEELGVTGAANDFIRAFNHHLSDEQSDSAVLAREALVRFTRKYHAELQDLEWQANFKAKLTQFRNAGIIDDQLMEYCLSKIPAEGNARERVKWSGGKFVARDSPSKQSQAPVDDASARTTVKRTCLCGSSAKDARGGIACSDPRCTRKYYHLACVGLERRVQGWRCPEC